MTLTALRGSFKPVFEHGEKVQHNNPTGSAADNGVAAVLLGITCGPVSVTVILVNNSVSVGCSLGIETDSVDVTGVVYCHIFEAAIFFGSRNSYIMV